MYAERAAIAAALAEEKETQNATPRRTRRSASGTSPPGAPPAHLTGKTQSTKQLLFSQIEEETAGIPPLLMQAWNSTQLGATQSYVCKGQYGRVVRPTLKVAEVGGSCPCETPLLE